MITACYRFPVVVTRAVPLRKEYATESSYDVKSTRNRNECGHVKRQRIEVNVRVQDILYTWCTIDRLCSPVKQ